MGVPGGRELPAGPQAKAGRDSDMRSSNKGDGLTSVQRPRFPPRGTWGTESYHQVYLRQPCHSSELPRSLITLNPGSHTVPWEKTTDGVEGGEKEAQN